LTAYVSGGVRIGRRTYRAAHVSGGVRVATPEFSLTDHRLIQPRKEFPDDVTPDGDTMLLKVAQYEDLIVEQDGDLKFRGKRVIHDTLRLPASVVYPL
jgi:hypothetical protein